MGWSAGGGLDYLFLQNFFIYVMLRLYTVFQSSTMPGIGQKVCGGWVGGWWVVLFKLILVFSLAKAEQFGCHKAEQIKLKLENINISSFCCK